MAEATFRHGDPVYADYTPAAGNVAAGQVVLIGNTAGWTTGIAHLDIVNNVLGALACGGGIYDVTMLTNMVQGAKVYWDDAINKVVTTSTNMALFGYIAGPGGTGANTTVEVFHSPYV